MANPIKTRVADLRESDLFYPRELSWLAFNARVLQEAADESVPIIERLRYLGIFSNNSELLSYHLDFILLCWEYIKTNNIAR